MARENKYVNKTYITSEGNKSYEEKWSKGVKTTQRPEDAEQIDCIWGKHWRLGGKHMQRPWGEITHEGEESKEVNELEKNMGKYERSSKESRMCRVFCTL